MIAIVELMTTLAALIREETEGLASPGRFDSLAAVAAAKQRLAETLECRMAERARLRPDWLSGLDDAERDALAEAAADLLVAAEANRSLLERQILLSGELMHAVSAELQRRAGGRNRLYAPDGQALEARQPAPVAVNTRL